MIDPLVIFLNWRPLWKNILDIFLKIEVYIEVVCLSRKAKCSFARVVFQVREAM